MKVGVIGTGSWATALVHTLSPHFALVYWFWPSETDRQFLIQEKKNPRYLSEVSLNLSHVHITGSPHTLISNSDLILLVVPSAFLTTTLKTYFSDFLDAFQNKAILSGIKGFEQTTGLPITKFLSKHLGVKVTGCIGGPAHAEEVIQGKHTVITLATLHWEEEAIQTFYHACMKTNHLTVIQSDDPTGVEYAAILKNVYSLLIGYLIGKGAGDNFIAATICSCLDEMETLLQHFHPHPLRQLIHSAYLGDFLVTAYSQHSRNRRLGELRSRSIPLMEAFQQMKMIAEGYYAIQILIHHYKIHAPLLSLVYELLYHDLSLDEVGRRIPFV
jgi:glycerol-3-phosphate dehydrogenase (NAD(P)+)